jgi:hypothetical protein
MAIRKKIFHNFFSNLSRRSESATRSKTLEGLFRQAKLCAQADQELHEEEREELIERLALGGTAPKQDHCAAVSRLQRGLTQASNSLMPDGGRRPKDPSFG